ncbi:NAD-dependent epimerase/dehydratase family protein [Variovorax sp. dw_954]|uniref:NAD-dependent epimerase/dehydratase family protein n=1 Tax=Variovorax sp. dw_954 TaxID=2720078 RepID=UPI001BD27184|nr:NAD-dependent epimerase/dehydratase family protein [Variovorax sp. dw_954]
MTRILITGATGFIGAHILQLAIGTQAGEIHAVSTEAKDRSTTGVRWHQANLCSVSDAVGLIEQVRPTHVIHAAWIATPGVYLHAPENFDWLVVSLAMARAFGKNGGRRWVGLGSSAEYAPDTGLCQEEKTPLVPASIYGKCKLACCQATLAAAQEGDFSAAWGRIFLPYGPGDSTRRLIPSLMAAMKDGQPVSTTEGKQLRDFVMSSDAANMLFRLLWNDESGAFNIGTGVATPVRVAMESLANYFNAHDLLQFGRRPMALDEPSYLVADMAKTKRVLGELKVQSLAEGLRQTVHQFLAVQNNHTE